MDSGADPRVAQIKAVKAVAFTRQTPAGPRRVRTNLPSSRAALVTYGAAKLADYEAYRSTTYY
jgi:hypothetical protein